MSKHYFEQTSNYFQNKKANSIFQDYFGKGFFFLQELIWLQYFEQSHVINYEGQF